MDYEDGQYQAYPRLQATYQEYACQARLDFLQCIFVIHADNLALHRDGSLQARENNVGKVSHNMKTIVSSVANEDIEDFVSSHSKLIVGLGADKNSQYFLR